ncbi:hypothetical protein [Burkholderia cenocepacia]|uniref:hypothetical protein n=1 Tax=Burkholderia cenocepacia TaxID=95486 RepID=UPI0038489DB2
MRAVGLTHIRGFLMSKKQTGETAVQSSPTDRRRFLNRVLDTGAVSLMAMRQRNARHASMLRPRTMRNSIT